MSAPGTPLRKTGTPFGFSRAGLCLYAAGLAFAFSLGRLTAPPASRPIVNAPHAREEAAAPARPHPAPDASADPTTDAQEVARLRGELDLLRARLESAEATALATGKPAVRPSAKPGEPASVEQAFEDLRAAVASGDDAEAKRLAGVLRKLVDKDPDAALRLLALAEGETDPRLVAHAYEAVRGNELLGDARLRARVLGLLRSHPDSAHKRAALSWLNRAIQRDAGALALITSGDLSTTVSLLRWDTDPALRREAAQLLQKFTDRPEVFAALRDVAGKIGDEAVDARLAALEAVRTHDSPETVSVLLRVLQDDPDDRMRRKAVESLAILAPKESKEEVVAALEIAIARETQQEQRGMMLLSLIRVSPDSASPVIRRLLPTVEDSKQREMLNATAEMLDAGERDWLKIMLKLQGRMGR